MNIQSSINKEVFIPHDERMLVAVEVQRRKRKRKRMSFLPPGARRDCTTFICVSVCQPEVTTKPRQLLITKIKQFVGSSSFTRRSQWNVEQLRQVNGIHPQKDSPEFDLVFDNTVDQWVARSSAEKCLFVHILYHACQTYCKGKAGSLMKAGGLDHVGRKGSQCAQLVQEDPAESTPDSTAINVKSKRKSSAPPRQPEFINCQSKLTTDSRTVTLLIYRCKVYLDRIKDRRVFNQTSPGGGQRGQRVTWSSVAEAVQRMKVSLVGRGDRLTPAEDKTVELMHKAQQLADAAHKLALKFSK
ncbi:syntaxin-binding protein 6-like [Antennarius striatus]|uniref:syntaxin-binding protein 6-like n=1 Tax=Antennarius striatus TaxID=241820 RepID=UPI0035AEBF7C